MTPKNRQVSQPIDVADMDSDGVPDECPGGSIPAVSDWGVAILALLVLVTGTVCFSHDRTARPTQQ
ncbi:MAG: hypothetical protein ACYTHJ_13045 [Planctomycetota bacterium]|jgi:hypothetical protein